MSPWPCSTPPPSRSTDAPHDVGAVGVVLALRRGEVVAAGATSGAEQELGVRINGQVRTAIADVGQVGVSRAGDEVVVNVSALDLGLGSGGFDIVCVNLTRGCDANPPTGAHVMKLNYTSLQHPVVPVEAEGLSLPVRRPVAVCALHGQLAPLAWAFARATPGARLGYVHTVGGALPAGHSRTVRQLRQRGLLAGHVSAGAAHGAEEEAMSVAGALHHGLVEAGWQAAVCAPGPGMVGSASALGHGGMAALDSAHGALALGCPTLLVARMSSADPRERHRGLSHHTQTVLDLLLAPVTVALPTDVPGPTPVDAGPSEVRPHGHRTVWRQTAAELAAYEASGLPSVTMGRTLSEDPLFFSAALAGGGALADMMVDR